MQKSLPNLRYQQFGTWRCLPHWSVSYIDLGTQLARFPLTDTRSVIALAIPTRAYAATFAALGIVLARSNTLKSSEEYFRLISSQPIGTSIIYRKRGQELKGKIDSISEQNGELWINISTGKRDSRRILLRENVANIIVAERDFKLPNYQKGSKVSNTSEFLQALVDDSVSFVSQTQLECLIVSRLSYIDAEVNETTLGLEISGTHLKGSPQDVLRIKQLLGANHAYKCQLVPTSSSIDENDIMDALSPPIVIFDGATAYLRHGHRWPMSHQIIMLDRSERSFQDAVDNINQSYTRRVEEKQEKLTVDFTVGVDAILFQEVIR